MKDLLKTLAIAALLAITQSSFAQGTAFTYQGRLDSSGAPVNGNYDLNFAAYGFSAGGSSLGTITVTNLGVTNGLFTVTMDMGPIFTGSPRWLEIGVRTNGGSTFNTLAPRQQLTPAPYAVFANTASNLSGTLPVAQLGGVVPLAQLPPSVVTTNDPASVTLTGTFSGNGAGLANVNAASLNGLTAANFWKASGNSGTSPGANYLGTSDNQSLELHVNGQRALQIQPTGTDSSHNGLINSVGGSPINAIAPGVFGSVIAGGGAANYQGNTGLSNLIASDLSFIGGGSSNVITSGSTGVVLTGGFHNQIQTGSAYSTISGGAGNLILSQSYESAIGGGYQNTIGSTVSFIGGGVNNSIFSSSEGSYIGGGEGNVIQGGTIQSAVVAGYQNLIDTNSTVSFIGGGDFNIIGTNSSGSVITGGEGNEIGTAAADSVIAGGNGNISVGQNSTISGGFGNLIYSSNSVVGGGRGNTVWLASAGSVVVGGLENEIEGSQSSVIAGGFFNYIAQNSPYSFIGGGTNNTIGAGAYGATIGGGYNNVIPDGSFYSTCGGGINNSVQGPGSTVPGGNGNAAIGVNSFAAGTFAQATNDGSFVITDQQYVNFYSLVNNSFNARFSGGYRFITGGGVLFSSGNIGINTSVGWSPGAGSWIFSSDRNLKDRFEQVDAQSVLEKVSQLPITEWSYKGYDQRHIGAMAQDFHTLFPLNEDDKTLNELDLHGVELAAIKGLNQKLEEKDARIADLEKRLEKLEQRLEK